MDTASVNYMAELEMEDDIFFGKYSTTTTTAAMESFKCPLNNFDMEAQYSFKSATPENDSYINYQSKPNRFHLQNSSVSSPSSSTKLISFKKGCNSNIDEMEEEEEVNNRKSQVFRNTTRGRDHVIAERKRREKLSLNFIALSAIVPGLKKMDKASILADTIKYMKKLQQRVKVLEDQAMKKVEGGSEVLVKNDDDNKLSRCSSCGCKSLPEIEVKVCGKDVLIRIQCDKHNRRVVTVLGEIEKHNLTVQSSTFLPFGNDIVDVTVAAQMNKENCVIVKDLQGSLRQALTV